MGKNARYRTMKAQEQTVGLNATERALLNEVVEWAGKFFVLLKEQAAQAHELLDQ